MKSKNTRGMDRREFMKLGLGAASVLALGGNGGHLLRAAGRKSTARKVIVLGFDGMDPQLVRTYMDAGRLPAFRKLASQGGFLPLQTSIPSQSPVAWSNFIAGTNPGGHGIYDFIHRDPETYTPVFSATLSEQAKKTIRMGNTVFPLSSGKVLNRRQGPVFWKILEEHDIPATIFKIPANYPPTATKQRTLSGMGTPDIKGTYGLFNYYTNESIELTQETAGGGRVHEVYVIGNRVEAKIPGPDNAFKVGSPETEIDFKVFVDPENPVAKIAIQGQEFILKEKEWSGWKKISFGLIPTQSVGGICLFYLKEVRPKFKLYVSPINIDPARPAMPISTPESYAKELEARFGPFFTKGLPADTSALDNGVLNEAEFLAQDDMVLDESIVLYEAELAKHESGLLFYYFSNTDQRQHMFWRLIDPQHPVYDAALAKEYGNVIEDIYAKMDEILDTTMRRADANTTIIVMSDHGFNTFRRAFNLNTWLKECGYHKLLNDYREAPGLLFDNTDWSRSRAYGMGLNGLYINRKGREGKGIVEPGPESDNLIREIAQKLEAVTDPKTGEKVVLRAYIGRNIYQGAYAESAPDIVLGFNRGYRIFGQSSLGSFPKDVLVNNTAKWSGDHMSAAEINPGILVTNAKIKSEAPSLFDLTASMLQLFGIDKTKEMIGKNIF